MRASEPIPQTVKISDAKSALASLVDAVNRKETRVLIEKRGAPVAALVSVDDLERLRQLDCEWETTTRSLERISEALADIPVEELEAKFDEIIAEGRTRDMADERRRVVAAMREPFRGVSSEEIERETAKAVAEVREEMRAERDERFAVIDRMREAFADVPPETIEREAERSVAAARERLRKQSSESAGRST